MSSSQDRSQMEKQMPLLTLSGPFSRPRCSKYSATGGGGCKEWCTYGIWGLERANHHLATWQLYVARIQSKKGNLPSRGLPCITSTYKCILMDAANTSFCVYHGPGDLPDPRVKETISHLYVQLPMTSLHIKPETL